MSIVITCPTCAKQASAPEASAGRKVQCPHCQAIIVVPGGEPVPAREEFEEEEPRYDERPSSRRRRRFEDDDDFDDRGRDLEERPRRRRRGGCFNCGSDAPPRYAEEINETGWILFVVLILFCTPICWIPLLTCKEQRRYCSDCGIRMR